MLSLLVVALAASASPVLAANRSSPATKSSPAAKKLVYVQTIYRHGDRAPKGRPYPADKYGGSGE